MCLFPGIRRVVVYTICSSFLAAVTVEGTGTTVIFEYADESGSGDGRERAFYWVEEVEPVAE